MSINLPNYVLVTPARNEAAFIEKTLTSVVAQTVRPLRWVIVSDGSTDGTDDIVRKYAAHHPWIELVRVPERSERHFAGKVYAFNAGYAKLAGLKYDVIGNLDADISFDDIDYFAFLMAKFAENPRLGLGGTPYRECDATYNYRFASMDYVPGACQLFRHQCFEEIGGYVPVKSGGVDDIPVFAARMKGWETKVFREKVYNHHRASGTAQHGKLVASFRLGINDYRLGYHPLWEALRTLYKMTKRPFIVEGVTFGAGYVWAFLRRVERPIPREMVAFCRREQMQRLIHALRFPKELLG